MKRKNQTKAPSLSGFRIWNFTKRRYEEGENLRRYYIAPSGMVKYMGDRPNDNVSFEPEAGICDSSGEPIFEWDIVDRAYKVDGQSWKSVETGVVRYDYGLLLWKIVCPDKTLMLNDRVVDDILVIGNFHENPERIPKNLNMHR